MDRDILRQAKEGGLLGIHVQITLAQTCLLKSARSYMVMNALDELGDVIKSVPSAEDLEQEKFDHTFDILVVTGADMKTVEDAMGTISEIDKVALELVDPDQATAPQAAAPAAEKAAPAAPKAAPAAAVSAPKPAAKSAPAKAAPPKKNHQSQSVRVDIDKLDTLMNLMGELVINKVRLEQIGQTHRLAELTETLEQMDRVTTDL